MQTQHLSVDQSQFVNLLRHHSSYLTAQDKERLNVIAETISNSLKTLQQAKINFVCTHNSRRSQLSEICCDIVAHYFNLNVVTVFSSGTESTAFNHRMIAALQSYKLDITTKENTSENPEYLHQIGEKTKIYKSKTYDSLDATDMIIVTVCSHADENCPVIPSAMARHHLGFVDPKVSDDTPKESETYRAKVLEIGSQCFYLLWKVKQLVD